VHAVAFGGQSETALQATGGCGVGTVLGGAHRPPNTASGTHTVAAGQAVADVHSFVAWQRWSMQVPPPAAVQSTVVAQAPRSEVVVSTCPEHPAGTAVSPAESLTLGGRTVVVIRET